jgi:CubicO group peptidase (beta-lactamase class C family)
MNAITHGFVADGYETIADAFMRGFATHPAMGAAVSIRVNGATVIDMWGGAADARVGRPWASDTVSVIFSCTKGLLAILALTLTQEGRLDLDAPVARYWPEFAQAGKSTITIRQLLTHQSGLSAIRATLTTDDVLDWATVIGHLERQAPLWPPGAGHAYHTLTYGWLVGEVIRRVTGLPIGGAFRAKIAEPLKADAWLGLPQCAATRVAHLLLSDSLITQTDTQRAAREAGTVDWVERAMTFGGAFPPALVTEAGGFNDPRVQAAQIPGAGGITTARALASIWSATVVDTDGVRLLDDGTIADAARPQTEGPPMFAAVPPFSRWGTGFQLSGPPARTFLSPHSFGHDGLGGQVGFADTQFRVGFGYITNFLEGAPDERAATVIEALRRTVQS